MLQLAICAPEWHKDRVDGTIIGTMEVPLGRSERLSEQAVG